MNLEWIGLERNSVCGEGKRTKKHNTTQHNITQNTTTIQFNTIQSNPKAKQRTLDSEEEATAARAGARAALNSEACLLSSPITIRSRTIAAVACLILDWIALNSNRLELDWIS